MSRKLCALGVLYKKELSIVSCDKMDQAFCMNFVLQVMNAQVLGTKLEVYPYRISILPHVVASITAFLIYPNKHCRVIY